MDITQALQQLIADYRRDYPGKWRQLLDTLSDPSDLRREANLSVYILGFHIGGIAVPLPDAMIEEASHG